MIITIIIVRFLCIYEISFCNTLTGSGVYIKNIFGNVYPRSLEMSDYLTKTQIRQRRSFSFFTAYDFTIAMSRDAFRRYIFIIRDVHIIIFKLLYYKSSNNVCDVYE